MSLQTWGIWTFTGIVSLLYILHATSSILLTIAFLVNALGQIIVFGYAVYARILDIKEKQDLEELFANL
jgi:hypothetical protein